MASKKIKHEDELDEEEAKVEVVEQEPLAEEYEVAEGGVVHHYLPRQNGGFQHVVLEPGVRVIPGQKGFDDGEDPKGMIRSLIRSGHLVEVFKRGKRSRATAPRMPGVPEQPVLPSEQDVAKKGIDGKNSAKAEAVAKSSVKELQEKAKQPKPGRSAKSHWVLDPKTLEGKSKVVLNAMIKERDAEAPQFESPEEAAAFLSQDFDSNLKG